MEFLFLATLYIVIWIVGYLLYLAISFFPALSNLWLPRHLHRGFDQLISCIPGSWKNKSLQIYVSIFQERNHFFQWVYLALVTGGHFVIIVDAWPLLAHKDVQNDLLVWTLGFLAANLTLFAVCCYGNPGRITAKNALKFSKIFAYDDMLYQQRKNCSTCCFVKPARSKHCATSDECVMKFDHFCAWTNNSIGLLNHRFFILFLTSICIMCCHGFVMATHSLQHLISINQLWTAKYLDSGGQPQAMTFNVLMQTLFLKYPRLVFVAVALVTLTVIMAEFTVYHVFLVATNQTTNERYKKHRLKRSGHVVPPNIYNEGIVNNLLQASCPHRVMQVALCNPQKRSNKRL